MDVIEKDVVMLQEKGFDISCDTQYWVQEQAHSGAWYIVKICFSLEHAIEVKKDHIQKWYGDVSVDQEFPVRIIMRHVVEVVL